MKEKSDKLLPNFYLIHRLCKISYKFLPHRLFFIFRYCTTNKFSLIHQQSQKWWFWNWYLNSSNINKNLCHFFAMYASNNQIQKSAVLYFAQNTSLNMISV